MNDDLDAARGIMWGCVFGTFLWLLIAWVVW